MSEEVNAIIDNLCEKLGTSAKFLIPELARLRITESAVCLFIALIVLAVGLITLPKAWRYDHREDKDRLDDSCFVIIPALLIFAGGVTAMIQSVSLAGWVASPTAKAVLEIVGMVSVLK